MQSSTLATAQGRHLATLTQPGASPTIVFLPGFNSDMTGAKAEHLSAWCTEHRRACLRFDYSGHGASDGQFTDGTITRWLQDALAVIDAASTGPLLLVGSSMGGWIALLAALARPVRIVGLLGIAAAADFTESLMWEAMAPTERDTLMRDGVLIAPSEYGAPLKITRSLVEDGRNHLLLTDPIPIDVPVRLLHGQQDADVPWEHSLQIAHHITGNDVQVTLIKDAGHRLSRPSDLAVLTRLLDALVTSLEPAGLGQQDGA